MSALRMKIWCIIMMAIAACGWSGGLAAAPATNLTARVIENLTLEEAIALAEDRQPQLAEARAMVEAAQGRARQAGAFPNPELFVGAQQLPLSGSQPNEKEYLAGVGQAIPLGRRLSIAREAELLDREVHARGLEVKRREVRKQVHSAFATALYQEQAWQAQREIQQSTAKAVNATRARVEAGDTGKDDLARVEMELARAEVELKRAESLRQQARLGLTLAIGDDALAVRSLSGAMDATFEIPALESLVANVSARPESARAEADVRARMVRVDAAVAERIPDVKIELLYHRLEASRSDTLDVGVSIPLPLFQRNQGRIREAQAEQAAAEARSRATRQELTTRLRESYLQLTTALANSRTMRTEILGRADAVLKAAEARYAAGDISLGEVLPVRREWAAVQLSYLETLREVMQAWAEVKSFQ
jgi:cobalt-zinc-cadmium efflux system outer membrane protein